MERRISMVLSVMLIGVGLTLMLFNVAGPWLEFQVWPLIIVGAGWLLLLPPLLVRGKRGMGGFFIPALPTLATGALCFFDTLFRWNVWRFFWPVEVMSVALGFLFAALYMHVTGLLVPAIIIGVNGLFMQFCTLTGRWELWSVMWAIEPFAVGLSLLVLNSKRQSPKLAKVGIFFCIFAFAGGLLSLGIAVLASFFSLWWIWRWIGALALLVGGAILFVRGLRKPQSAATPNSVAAEPR